MGRGDLAGLDQKLLDPRVCEDRFREPVGMGLPVAISKRQPEEVGHHPPAEFAGDGGLQEDVAIESLRRSAPAEAAGGARAELQEHLRQREGNVRGRLQQIPAERVAVQAHGAGDGEVAVDEGADAAAAAGEIRLAGLADDGVRLVPGKARRVVHQIVRHGRSSSGEEMGRVFGGASAGPTLTTVASGWRGASGPTPASGG